MKARGQQVRFLLVSATVPNIEDIAAWIGDGSKEGGGPAKVFNVRVYLSILIFFSPVS